MRIIMLKNWQFDIFNSVHWSYSWNLWLDGWIIDETREWAFVIIVLTLIPLWLTGWTALCLFKWENLFYNVFISPFAKLKSLFGVSAFTPKPKVKKKISYKKVRPRSVRASGQSESTLSASSAFDVTATTPKPKKKKKPAVMEPAPTIKEEPSAMNHSIFDMDDDDDDFDIDLIGLDDDDFEEEKPKKKQTQNNNQKKNKQNKSKKNNNQNNNQNKNKNSNNKNNSNKDSGLFGVLSKKGYHVVTSVSIGGEVIDFVGLSKGTVQICLVDKEPGDWLADEERFNDEEPLWFSESSHRVSPVRKALAAKEKLEKEFANAEFEFDIETNIIVQTGNIINAEDMFDTWDQLNVSVSRIDTGGPDELKLFNHALNNSGGNLAKADLDKTKKLIRSLG